MPQLPTSSDFAVLFDMDGTLVNTEPLWESAEIALMDQHALPWTSQQAGQLTGLALEAAAKNLRDHGLPMEIEDIISRLQQSVMERLAIDIPWIESGYRLISECERSGVPMALVTMSRRAMAQIIVDAAPGTFTTSITGDEVEHPKPHPQPYLQAAQRIGLDPRQCIVIEDSVTGAQSGHDAGCTVFTTGPRAGQILGLRALPQQATLADLRAALTT